VSKAGGEGGAEWLMRLKVQIKRVQALAAGPFVVYWERETELPAFRVPCDQLMVWLASLEQILSSFPGA